MYILGIIERQIERLQEVSADADYSQLMAVDALETEIKVSEEIRKLISLHNDIYNQKVKKHSKDIIMGSDGSLFVNYWKGKRSIYAKFDATKINEKILCKKKE